MDTRWRQWVVSLLIVFIGLVFGGSAAHAQTAPTTKYSLASAQAYKPLAEIDTGDVPSLIPLLDTYPADKPVYNAGGQAGSTVVLSPLTLEPQPIVTASSATYRPDKVHRLKLLAIDLMLMLSSIVGIIFTLHKSSSLKQPAQTANVSFST